MMDDQAQLESQWRSEAMQEAARTTREVPEAERLRHLPNTAEDTVPVFCVACDEAWPCEIRLGRWPE